MDSDAEGGGVTRSANKHRYRRKNHAYYNSPKALKKSIKGLFSKEGRSACAFVQKRRILLAGGASPDSPDFGVLEATVRFGVRYKKKTLSEILSATLTKLIHEVGNGPYEVG